MSVVFIKEVEHLKRQILTLSAQAEESLILAVKALLTRDEELAQQVIRGDFDVDQFEVQVEEEALKILALYQPVATDLRFLAAVLKINSDLERIGDLATNIAKRAVKMCNEPALLVPDELGRAAVRARDMVHDSLNAFVNFDAEPAKVVCGEDEEVDQLCRQVRRFVEEQIQKNPARVGCYLEMLLASRNIERIGDHATNIAEDVIYLVEGTIVRHRADGKA
ncbi:MAG: phosphate signaling complex protein PhoU [Verrucomicrobia bacterium]|nr:phosphate signaling complex protein PhoU [Verrucomicrobiota bacterium]